MVKGTRLSFMWDSLNLLFNFSINLSSLSLCTWQNHPAPALLKIKWVSCLLSLPTLAMFFFHTDNTVAHAYSIFPLPLLMILHLIWTRVLQVWNWSSIAHVFYSRRIYKLVVSSYRWNFWYSTLASLYLLLGLNPLTIVYTSLSWFGLPVVVWFGMDDLYIEELFMWSCILLI